MSRTRTWDLRVPSMRLRSNFRLGFAAGVYPKGAFCDLSLSDPRLAMRPSAAAAATALPSATALAAGVERGATARRCSSEFHSPHSGHCPCHLRVSPPQEPQTNTGLARAIDAPSVEFQLGCAGAAGPEWRLL